MRFPQLSTLISASAVLASFVGCGSRSALRPEDAPVECTSDDDCVSADACALVACIEGTCTSLGNKECTTDDACSVAACEPTSGECVTTPKTFDIDRDGYPAPLPGKLPGDVDACGTDCDDTSALARPGGFEVCDGVDNDCDGIIDNGAAFLDAVVPEGGMVSVGEAPLEASAARGLTFAEGTYVVGYWGREDATLSYVRGIGTSGAVGFSQRNVSNVSAPSFGVDVAWSGGAIGAVWSDARQDDNYEVYFARFDALGQKLAPDLRLTTADDFSIHPRVTYDQGRFVVVYDDHRDGADGPVILGQLIDPNGVSLGSETMLSDFGEGAEQPILAASPSAYGLVYTSLVGTDVGIVFRGFDKSLSPLSARVLLTERDARAPRVTAVGELFLVTWDVYGADGPGAVIRGALVDARGTLIGAPRDLTSGALHARSHATLSFGDRVLLLWADDFDGNYELYAEVIGLDLSPIEPRTRLTNDPSDTLYPYVKFGSNGQAGVLFDDWRSGAHGAYFMTFGCAAPSRELPPLR